MPRVQATKVTGWAEPDGSAKLRYVTAVHWTWSAVVTRTRWCVWRTMMSLRRGWRRVGTNDSNMWRFEWRP